jgi:hypothetical protein
MALYCLPDGLLDCLPDCLPDGLPDGLPDCLDSYAPSTLIVYQHAPLFFFHRHNSDQSSRVPTSAHMNIRHRPVLSIVLLRAM